MVVNSREKEYISRHRERTTSVRRGTPTHPACLPIPIHNTGSIKIRIYLGRIIRVRVPFSKNGFTDYILRSSSNPVYGWDSNFTTPTFKVIMTYLTLCPLRGFYPSTKGVLPLRTYLFVLSRGHTPKGRRVVLGVSEGRGPSNRKSGGILVWKMDDLRVLDGP